MNQVNDPFSKFMIDSILPTPDADKKFIENYNSIGKLHQLAAENLEAFSEMPFSGSSFKEAACYNKALGIVIDEKKDIWEGLDYKVVKDLDLGKDRLIYIPGNTENDINIHLSPPEAGHNSGFVHWENSPNKSLAMTLLEYGNLFITDKQSAIPGKPFTLEDAFKRDVDVTNYIYKNTGKKFHKFGICQGAWETFVGAYLEQDKVASLFNSVGPFNWHSKDLSDLTRDINPGNPNHADKVNSQLKMINYMVEKNNGVMPGAWNVLGFLNFSSEQLLVKDYLQLAKDCSTLVHSESKEDRNKAKAGIYRFTDFREKFMRPQTLGGDFFCEVAKKLWAENQLYENKLEALGRNIIMKEFSLPYHSLYGNKDNITSRGQATDHISKIGTHHNGISIGEYNGGHLASMNGSNAKGGVRAWLDTLLSPYFGKKEFSQQEYHNKVMLKYAKRR